jgi:hypothetical protein
MGCELGLGPFPFRSQHAQPRFDECHPITHEADSSAPTTTKILGSN